MTNRSDRDRLWDHFITSPPADAKNDLTPHIESAPEGRVYPIQSASDDPDTMSQTIKELGQWLGVNLVGIAAVDPSLQPEVRSEGEGDTDEEGGQTKHLPFGIVCVVHSDHDPEVSKGLGGQKGTQLDAVVIHHLRAYILELGYRASFSDLDPVAVAEAAELGRRDQSGRFIAAAGKKGSYAVLSHVLSTDLPMAPDGRLIAA